MNEVSLIGYHGTDFANTHTILSDNYQISEGDTHWLGDGVYFFVESVLTNAEKAIELAEKWAIAQSWDNDTKKYKYNQYTVMASKIEVKEENFLDLTTADGIKTLLYLAENFLHLIKNVQRNRKRGLRFYDGLLLNWARKANIFSFDVIKGNFYIKFKNERVNKIELRTCNCTICSVYNPQKNIKFNKIIKKGAIV